MMRYLSIVAAAAILTGVEAQQSVWGQCKKSLEKLQVKNDPWLLTILETYRWRPKLVWRDFMRRRFCMQHSKPL